MVFTLVIVKDSRILKEERQAKKATEVAMPQNKENEVLVEGALTNLKPSLIQVRFREFGSNIAT